MSKPELESNVLSNMEVLDFVSRMSRERYPLTIKLLVFFSPYVVDKSRSTSQKWQHFETNHKILSSVIVGFHRDE